MLPRGVIPLAGTISWVSLILTIDQRSDERGRVRPWRRRCSPEDGDGGSDVDVPVVLLLLWLVRDVLRAPILTVKNMEAALGVPNDGDDVIPSSGSNGAPATSMSNLVHRFQINKIMHVWKLGGEPNGQGDRSWGGSRRRRQPSRSAMATSAAAMRKTT